MPATVDLILRRGIEADAGAIALAGAATFLETYAGVLGGADIVAHCQHEHSASRYLRWLQSPTARVWVVETPDTAAMVGYLVGHVVDETSDLPLEDLRPTDFEIRRIYLLSRFQGAGIGRSLMERAISDARSLGAQRILLGVHSRNERAIGFYQQLGFVICGSRIFRIGSCNCDDRIMERRIP